MLVIGNVKGREIKKDSPQLWQPNPEGYRKAMRAMKIAEKFGRPVITLIDLVGAYPGLGAEERGQPKRSRATCGKCRVCSPDHRHDYG